MVVEDPECSWHGVRCANGDVIGLDLNGNNLNGPLPESLGNLLSLQTRLMNDNKVSGPLPSSLTELQDLFIISLASNQLSGAIPTGFGDLPVLAGIALSENRLSGPIPGDLGDLANIQFPLGLSGNLLSGPIPANLANLMINKGQSIGLFLGENQLTGEIPDSFNTINSGELIDVSSNKLTGVISPAFVANAIGNNIELILDDNLFRCPYPSAIEQQFAEAGESCIPSQMPAPIVSSIEESDEILRIKITIDTLGFFSVTGFTFRCREEGSLNELIRNESGLMATFTGLTNDVSYECTVTAQTTEGDSEVSSAVFGTPSAPAPGLPLWLLVEGLEQQ